MHTDHDTLSTFDSDKSSQTSTKLFDRKRRLLIYSLNAPSLLKHKSEIEMLLRDNKIDIFALRTTVPLVAYIRNSLRFWYYASVSTCCQNLEKKLGSPGKFGRKRGSNF